MSNTALDLYYAGKLKEAAAAATDQVRKAPTDNNARTFLAELLMFSGELDRADRQLEALSTQDPQAAVHVAMLRQLLRADQARQKFFTDGAVPDFLELPGERIQLVLKASIALREKDHAAAATLLRSADELFPKLKGTCDGQPFEGLRDLDDLTATFFEALAPNGKYYWIPMENVVSLTFQPHQRARDLLWRRARMVLKSDLDTEVLLPAVYAGSHLEADQRFALGQMTDWRTAAEGAPVRGVGQRTLLIGDADRPFVELKELKVEA
ncbi:MAG: type VI secretion system accessory protein TagJ [Gemmataceae bacterium]